MSERLDFIRRPDTRRARKAAFTLIELLVVIAVIGILASLLLPALASAKERAKSLGCQGNLKQIGMAVIMYANEHNDSIPAYSTWPADLVDQLCPRTASKLTVWTCPTAFSRHPYLQTYGINAEGTAWSTTGVRLSTWFRTPSVTFLFSDSSWNTGGWYSGTVGYHTDYIDRDIIHSGGASYAFVDGHVANVIWTNVTIKMWQR